MSQTQPSTNAEPRRESPLEGIASFFVLIAVWLFAITFAFQNFVIPSASMASTLLVGDHVLVDRVTFMRESPLLPFVQHRDPARNDVVVFFKPATEPDGTQAILVKRIVGIPGDRIHLRHGILYRNGVAQAEPQAAMPTGEDYDPYRDDFPSVPPGTRPNITASWSVDLPEHLQGEDLVVPADSYFVMGDNRTRSLDGRFWGFVPRANILGKPLFVYWSFNTPSDRMYKTSVAETTSFTAHEILHFFDETRWRRTFQIIR